MSHLSEKRSLSLRRPLVKSCVLAGGVKDAQFARKIANPGLSISSFWSSAHAKRGSVPQRPNQLQGKERQARRAERSDLDVPELGLISSL